MRISHGPAPETIHQDGNALGFERSRNYRRPGITNTVWSSMSSNKDLATRVRSGAFLLWKRIGKIGVVRSPTAWMTSVGATIVTNVEHYRESRKAFG